jgi:NAD(P)-dependent dehydrogenase (short-subunit alcohol dehydrogenase family)
MMHQTLESFVDQIRSTIPLRRIGTPEDMAGTTIFLSSRAGAYLTGETIRVDGGITTQQG